MINLKNELLLRKNLDKIKNKNLLVRVDFNVSLENRRPSESYRILSVKKTLEILKLAKRVILISHLGDPSKRNKNYSLKKILTLTERLLKIKFDFLEDFRSPIKSKFNIFENLRFWKGEKEGDLPFAKKLSSLGEIYVYEAFSVSHRKHSSVYFLTKIMPTLYGFNFEKEINLLNRVIKAKNLALILSGAKISTKLPLIKKFLNRAKVIILGGGLANTYLKAKGFVVGKSLVENKILKNIRKINSPKILTPFDFIVTNKNKIYHRFLGEIKKGDKILDIGSESLKIIYKELKPISSIVVNGPLGYVENKKFEKGTLELVNFLKRMRGKFILFGGGDTLSFLEKKNLLKNFKISTGGGAMLHYLANGKLWVRTR